MHNFVYLAQRRSQEFSCEPNFGGGRAPRLAWLRHCSEHFYAYVTRPAWGRGGAMFVECPSVRACVRAALDLRHSPIRLGVHYYTVGRKKEPLFFHD